MATDLERRIETMRQALTGDRKKCPKCTKDALVFWDVYPRPIGKQEHRLNLLYQCEKCDYKEEVIEASPYIFR